MYINNQFPYDSSNCKWNQTLTSSHQALPEFFSSLHKPFLPKIFSSFTQKLINPQAQRRDVCSDAVDAPLSRRRAVSSLYVGDGEGKSVSMVLRAGSTGTGWGWVRVRDASDRWSDAEVIPLRRGSLIIQGGGMGFFSGSKREKDFLVRCGGSRRKFYVWFPSICLLQFDEELLSKISLTNQCFLLK